MASPKRVYFGTDGVRGKVGEIPLTADFALKLANAAVRVLAPSGGTVLIGKDTRLSGYMFESSLEAGLVSAGVDVLLAGPLPTPGVAYMTKQLNCAFGIVISASHNLYDDNGIKFFNGNGVKISDELELEIEKLLAEPPVTVESTRLGRAKRIDGSRARYQEFCASTLPKGTDLSGMKLVVDCAHGATYKVAPRTLMDLGADTVSIGVSPNGRNINDKFGSTAPQIMQLLTRDLGADAGLAFDGDGDRLLMSDTEGNLINGDQILYILAKDKQEAGTLKGPVVGTLMTNLGLELGFAELGIPFKRAKVGDRYVLEMLEAESGILGGEASGHILMLDLATTGDALMTALRVLSIMKKTGRSLKELVGDIQQFPQLIVNVEVEKTFDPLEVPSIKAALHEAEGRLGKTGRIVLRASGTEPLIRVMVEAQDAEVVKREAEALADVVRASAA